MAKHFYTRDQISEMKKCIESPIYFIKNYCHISHPKGGRIRFDPYPTQERDINNYATEARNITWGARQSGTDAAALAYLLWYVTFHGRKGVRILAEKNDWVTIRLNFLLEAYDSLPEWMRPRVLSRDRKSIEFDNGTRIIGSSVRSPEYLRGYSIHQIIWFDAHWVSHEVGSEMWYNLIPHLRRDAKIIMTSTGDHDRESVFKEIWRSAMRRHNDFVTGVTRWDDIPGRGEAFRQRMIDILGEEKWAHEYAIADVTGNG